MLKLEQTPSLVEPTQSSFDMLAMESVANSEGGADSLLPRTALK